MVAESGKHGPWEIIGRETKYHNRFGLNVFEDKVIRPDGKEGLYGWVEFKEGSSVLPLDDQGNVYLGEIFPYALGRTTLITVGGGIDSGETPLDAARRELMEELGIEASAWTDLGEYSPSGAVVKGMQYLFLAQQLKFTETRQDPTEKIKVVKMPLEEAVNQVMANKIVDGQSMTLILKAKEILKK